MIKQRATDWDWTCAAAVTPCTWGTRATKGTTRAPQFLVTTLWWTSSPLTAQTPPLSPSCHNYPWFNLQNGLGRDLNAPVRCALERLNMVCFLHSVCTNFYWLILKAHTEHLTLGRTGMDMKKKKNKSLIHSYISIYTQNDGVCSELRLILH